MATANLPPPGQITTLLPLAIRYPGAHEHLGEASRLVAGPNVFRLVLAITLAVIGAGLLRATAQDMNERARRADARAFAAP